MATLARIGGQKLAVVSCVDPDAYTTGDVNDDVIDMLYWRRVTFLVMAGDLGSSATLNFKVYGDTASGGAFATQITGKEITALTQAGTDSNKQSHIEVTAEEVAAQGFRYIRGTMSVGAATSDCGVVALGEPAHYAPASNFDLSSVDEYVG